ncbi:hypothetical protein HOH45_09305 [bacterium]|jgi:hypothetical protein|nr:hypothetical protein [bacterium]
MLHISPLEKKTRLKQAEAFFKLYPRLYFLASTLITGLSFFVFLGVFFLFLFLPFAVSIYLFNTYPPSISLIFILILLVLLLRILFFLVPDAQNLEDDLFNFDKTSLRTSLNKLRLSRGAVPIENIKIIDDFSINIKPKLVLFFIPLGFNLEIGFPCLLGLSLKEIDALISVSELPFQKKFKGFHRFVFYLSLVANESIDSLKFDKRFFLKPLRLLSSLLDPYFTLFLNRFYRQHLLSLVQLGSFNFSKDFLSQTLFKFDIQKMYLSTDFWPRIFGFVGKKSLEECFSYATLMSDVYDIPARQSTKYLNRALLDYPWKKNSTLTSPELIKHLSLTIKLPTMVTIPCLKSCYPEHWEEILMLVDTGWQQEVKHIWEDKEKDYKKYIMELELLEKNKSSDFNQKIKKASLIEAIHGSKQAFPKYQDLCKNFPDQGRAWFETGKLYLNNLEKKGLDYMEKAMNITPTSKSKCYLIIRKYYLETGQHDRVKEIQALLIQNEKMLDLAEEERMSLTEDDTFSSHNLPPLFVKDLRDFFQHYNSIRTVFFVKKNVKYLVESPIYVTLIRGSRSDIDIVKTNDILPSPTLFIIEDDYEDLFLEKIKHISNAVLFSKS